MRTVLLAGVLGVLGAGLTTGCGDGMLNKEEYVSRLNAMCEDFRAREKQIGEPQTLTDLREKGTRILDAFEKAIVEPVHNLEVPGEIADQADRLVELADHQRDVLRALVAAARDNDVGQVENLASENDALNLEATSIARELGAGSCAGRS